MRSKLLILLTLVPVLCWGQTYMLTTTNATGLFTQKHATSHDPAGNDSIDGTYATDAEVTASTSGVYSAAAGGWTAADAAVSNGVLGQVMNTNSPYFMVSLSVDFNATSAEMTLSNNYVIADTASAFNTNTFSYCVPRSGYWYVSFGGIYKTHATTATTFVNRLTDAATNNIFASYGYFAANQYPSYTASKIVYLGQGTNVMQRFQAIPYSGCIVYDDPTGALTYFQAQWLHY